MVIYIVWLGKLKWGVGKLIAHSPHKPIVIPIFFSGTEHLIDTDPETGKTNSYIPQLGHKVDLRVGDAINFDDLIEEHEKQFGPLWKYSANTDDDDEVRYAVNNVVETNTVDKMEVKTSNLTAKVKQNFHKYWDSKKEDKILYSKITARIEKALAKLNEESNIEKALSR